MGRSACRVSAAKIDPGLVERFRRVGGDLRLLIVAEDWCPDSVHTVPYVAALAAPERALINHKGLKGHKETNCGVPGRSSK
jgi:Thioredoxin